MKNLSLLLSFILLFCLLRGFPSQSYDFHLPTSSLSPFESSVGGVNLTDSNNQFIPYTNPALLKDYKQTMFGLSFSIPPRKKSFKEMLKTNPLLEDSKFRGVSVQTKRAGMYYQVLADEHIDETTALQHTYKDFNLSTVAICVADTAGAIDWGLGLKYIFGRMVYLNEIAQDSAYVHHDFVDSKANGYSFDLGIYRKMGNFHFGFVVYDVYSKLFWEDQKNVKLRTRAALNVELRSGNFSLLSGSSNLWNIHERPYYNQGIRYDVALTSSKKNPQSMSMSAGMSSKDYKNKDTTLFTYGMSYYISYIRVDVAIQSQGWKANNSQYLFSVSMGE